MAKKQRIQYLYPYKRFQIMVGHIDSGKTSDYYYLNKLETLKYMLTGMLPEESLSRKFTKKFNSGKNRPSTPKGADKQ